LVAGVGARMVRLRSFPRHHGCSRGETSTVMPGIRRWTYCLNIPRNRLIFRSAKYFTRFFPEPQCSVNFPLHFTVHESIYWWSSQRMHRWMVGIAVLNTKNKTLKDWHALHLRCFVGVLVLFRPAAKSSKSDWGIPLEKTTQQKESQHGVFSGGFRSHGDTPIAGWFINVYKFYKGTSYIKMDDLWVLPWLWNPLWPYSWLRNVRFHVAMWPGGCHVQTAFLSGWISSCAFPGMDHEHCVSARFFFSATVSGPGKHLWNLGMALISCWFDHRFSVDFTWILPQLGSFQSAIVRWNDLDVDLYNVRPPR
jgi:hypothetical protein